MELEGSLLHSQETANQSTPHHTTSWRYILILSFHLRLGLPSDQFPSHLPTETPYFSPVKTIQVILSVIMAQHSVQWPEN